jgi:hypothetical protein
MKVPSVWVVEDSLAYAKALRRQVEILGGRVYSVSSVRGLFPADGDLVFLDIMGTDSDELAPGAFGPNVRIYTMSACPDFAPDLVKPLSLTTLKRLIFGGDRPACALAVPGYEPIAIAPFRKAA